MYLCMCRHNSGTPGAIYTEPRTREEKEKRKIILFNDILINHPHPPFSDTPLEQIFGING